MKSQSGVMATHSSIDPKRVLADVSPRESFWFHNGIIVRNIYELVEQIRNLTPNSFVYHSNPDHDDFAKWVKDALQDEKLAADLTKERNQKRYIKRIKQRIQQHESNLFVKEKLLTPLKQGSDNIRLHAKEMATLSTLLILLIVILFINQNIYTQELGKLELKFQDLKQRDIIMQNLLIQTVLQQQNLSGAKTVTEESPAFEELFSYKEKFSPEDRISEDQIKVYKDRVVIFLNNASWAKFESTGSMLPTLNEEANAIEIVPLASEQIKPGDIISYTSDYAKGVIIHRVVETGEDADGWYAITKGDNNKIPDPYKVRFEQVQRVLIGIIY
ncbi:MAG: hypothetical protein ABIG95_06425 [Candidatus Woesearchaeota archaeon]